MWHVIAIVWSTWTGMQDAIPIWFAVAMTREECEEAIKDTYTYRNLAVEYVEDIEEYRLGRGVTMIALRCHDMGVEL